jgi:plastocyanin
MRSAALGLIVVTLLAGWACRTASVREVTLVARGMTFALPEQPASENPTVRLRAGERVRLVLKNEAAGLVHDLVIPDWNVTLEAIPAGETSSVTFTVPEKTGQVEYRCQPHAAMMSGVVDVTP